MATERSKRKDHIIALLGQTSEMSVNEIADILKVSSMTIRRYLHELEEEGLVRYPAHQHDIHHRVRKGTFVDLRHIGNFPCQGFGAYLLNIFPVEENAASGRTEEAEHDLDQGAFPAPVGSEQGDDLTLRNGETDIVQHGFLRIAKRYLFHFDQRFQFHPFFAFLSIIAKNGMPMSEVVIPMGISTLKSIRETSSTTIR